MSMWRYRPLTRFTVRIDDHDRLAGPAFSPDGRRLYFSSQQGTSGSSTGSGGITYEVTGPFRTQP